MRRKPKHIEQLETLGCDPAVLVGKTIERVEISPEDDDRVHDLALTFTDGTSATITYWAAYADDASLELKVPDAGPPVITVDAEEVEEAGVVVPRVLGPGGEHG